MSSDAGVSRLGTPPQHGFFAVSFYIGSRLCPMQDIESDPDHMNEFEGNRRFNIDATSRRVILTIMCVEYGQVMWNGKGFPTSTVQYSHHPKNGL